MSASPSRFNLISPSKSNVESAAVDQLSDSSALVRLDEAVKIARKGRVSSLFALFAAFVVGVVAGYFLYLLWQQVSLQEATLAQHQSAIGSLTANGVAVSNQVNRLAVLDNNVDSLKALFIQQSERLAQLEKNQTGMHDQLSGMNARWQRQVREFDKARSRVTSAPSASPAVTRAESQTPSAPATPVSSPSGPAAQQSGEKHNETFSPDLKPTQNAYAQMSQSGLVVWMTPRPGFSKPVPTSVLGHVRGLGMLVHNWDDNNHYFITESGSWIIDQR